MQKYYPATYPRGKESLLKDILRKILQNSDKIKSRKDLQQTIRDFLTQKKESFYPKLWMLYFTYLRFFSEKQKNPSFLPLIKVVKIRSLSGIVPLSVFTRPEDSCPYNCIYCPIAENAPKSYFPDEAAVRRAIRAEYDPFEQTKDRLIQFFLSGHPIDKIDLIIQGGTFSFYPKKYRQDFVKGVFDACNSNTKDLIIKGDLKNYQKISKNLSEAKKINETSDSRIIGITIETRPDFINPDEILFLRKLGTTRVELGAQTTDPRVLQLTRRGHTLQDLVQATYLLKEAGFKITYHLMPGLPGSSVEKDIKMLQEVFSDPRFRPDSIKFYPTQVVYNSQLLDWYKQGKYQPITEEQLLKIVLEFKKNIVPEWLRIQRLVRDLTRQDVAVETFPSNFRQNLEKELKKRKISCPCIRCREIRDQKPTPPVELKITKYSASKGIEYFLQFVDKKNKILGFLRLRIPEHFLAPKKDFFLKNIAGSALIRELHIYGQSTPISDKGDIQHTGLGKKLIQKAEEIAKSYGCKRIAVISGVGVREYYRRLGFELEDQAEYMLKPL